MDHLTSGLSRARRSLETTGRFPGGALPADISDSWTRSLSLSLDPLALPEPHVRTAAEYGATRARHADLIRFARPELELIYDQIAGSNFMIALGAPDGVILETLTDTQFADTAAGRSVIPGSIWTEDLRGTNALGMCAATRQSAQVYGGEHFLRAHQDISCISAPIFDGRGGLAGVLDALARAHGGTLYLDEITGLSATAQSALTRVLDFGENRRLGDTTMRLTDLLIVASSAQPLDAAV